MGLASIIPMLTKRQHTDLECFGRLYNEAQHILNVNGPCIGQQWQA